MAFYLKPDHAQIIADEIEENNNIGLDMIRSLCQVSTSRNDDIAEDYEKIYQTTLKNNLRESRKSARAEKNQQKLIIISNTVDL